MVASTNHLDQLDPGLSSRPSRFDRKYLFPIPSEAERIMYCDYWREKLRNEPQSEPPVKFPKKLSPAIAGITQDFSFAYLKEAFVATLLAIANDKSEKQIRGREDDEGGDLDDYELWREMKTQVRLLKEDMDTRDVVYHAQEPMDLAMHSTQNERSPAPSASPTPDTVSNLPFRPGAPRNARSLNNPSLMDVDRDSRHAPLMTDDGMFLDVGGVDAAAVF